MSERYEDRSVDDLHELAAERGIKGHAKKSKPELIAALRGEGDPNDIMVAIESGSAMVDGVELVFNKDTTRLARSHPLVRSQPHHFAEAEEGLSYEVESATAAPGEKRG